ncbi:hypothetical protein [Acidihalobacter ferrooxydans]|uniref:Uncharacterized protein n=1 Tax=Acidihalobacter ferrooxydans TaxID=1765967 RepID=A0A1P8UIZ3_9GAMM|nr:hypothetical protein [Acidihalobacter ferrooxydans]APZ43790.1 hypothetical protein BW247_12420 [Acidihalobacter ferrooxydans]
MQYLSWVNAVGMIAERLDAAIYQRLGVSRPLQYEQKRVAYADHLALRAEARCVLPSRGDWAGNPDDADVMRFARHWNRLPQGDVAGLCWLEGVLQLTGAVAKKSLVSA